MVEVYPNLYVGKECDTEWFWNQNILYCAKEPWHRQLLGYETKGAPYGHPEYFYAIREDKSDCGGQIKSLKRMYLNLVDSPDPAYIPPNVIDAGIKFIDESISKGEEILVACNQGESRAPGIAFLWMWEKGYLPRSFEESGPAFVKLYPDFRPGNGIFKFIKKRINDVSN